MTSDSLADRVDRAIDAFPSYVGEERFEAEGAIFVRDRSIPDKYYANHVEQVTVSTPQEIARLIDRVEVEFKGFRHRSFYVDRDTPTEFEAWLLMEGYQRSDSLVMVLTGELRGTPMPHEIRLVETDVDWQALYDLVILADREFDPSARQTGGERPSDARDQRIAMLQSVSPPVRYWLAYAEGAPRAFFSSWISTDGIAVLDDLYTHPGYRRRGLATALVHLCVADSRARGAGPVALETDPSDTPKLMYAAMGFRPLSVSYEYLKTFEC
ncbi:MAG: GNAT family N-acetyltransferase [Dehalococcoidia bacterium]|nr:GNAT family N-acetyltransferase [Dehalococcoidia bacterium]